MFAILLLATAPVLNLDPGQSFEIVGHMDCDVDAGVVDLNGATSTSSIGYGKKRISLLFVTQWPADLPKPDKKTGLLAFVTQNGTTTLNEMEYDFDYVPTESDAPQPSLLFQSGMTTYFLAPRQGSSKWDYEETQLLVHGAKQTYKGVCEIRGKGE